MRVAVVGVGGVGGYFGGRLAHAGEEVIFVARGRTLEALHSNGLRVDSINGDFAVEKVNATDNPASAGRVDAIIVATKAWQVREAAELVRPMVGPDTIVVPLENGMDAPGDVASVLGAGHAFGGLCTIVSFVVEPGVIRHAAAAPFIMLGELDRRVTPRAERLRDALRSAGVKTDIPPDIHKSMWSKFVFISPLSGVGAVTRVPIGVFRSVPESRQMLVEAVDEVVAVAKAKGVQIDDDIAAKTMQRYDELSSDSTSSLQRDVMAGKPSELEAQLGAVVRLGKQTGVSTPVHRFLYHALLPAEGEARKKEKT